MLLSRTQIIYFLFFMLLAGSLNGQDSIQKTSNQLIIEDISRLKTEIEFNKELIKVQSDRNDDLRETSGKFIDWTTLLFTAFTLLFLIVGIIAGVMGYREFTDIKKANTQIKKLHTVMSTELNEVKNLRVKIQDDLGELQEHTSLIVQKLQKDIHDIKIKIEVDSKISLKTIYLLNQGINDFRLGDLDKASHSFRGVLRLNKNDYTAKCYLARCYFDQKKTDLGIKTISEAVLLDPNNAFAYKIQGENYRRIGDYKTSIQSLERANEIQRGPAVLNSLGYSYLKDNQIDKAIAVFQNALRNYRRSSTPCGLGKAYLVNDEYEKAKKYFNETILFSEEEISRNASNVWPYYNIAYAQMALHNKKSCLEHLKKALSKNQNLEAMKEQLGDYNMTNRKVIPAELLDECVQLIQHKLNQIERK